MKKVKILSFCINVILFFFCRYCPRLVSCWLCSHWDSFCNYSCNETHDLKWKPLGSDFFSEGVLKNLKSYFQKGHFESKSIFSVQLVSGKEKREKTKKTVKRDRIVTIPYRHVAYSPKKWIFCQRMVEVSFYTRKHCRISTFRCKLLSCKIQTSSVRCCAVSQYYLTGLKSHRISELIIGSEIISSNQLCFSSDSALYITWKSLKSYLKINFSE